MAVLGNLIKSLSTKLNLDLNDEKLKPLFALETVIDDAHAAAFEQQLMTETAALANTKIRNTIKAESLNGLDAVLEELMSENEFDDNLKAEMKKADTSFKRTKLVAAKIAELKEAKAKAVGGDDKKAIQKQIDDLSDALKNEKAATEQKIKSLNEAHEADIYNMGLESLLQTKKYYTEDVPVAVHAQTAKTLLEQSLAKNGAKLIYDKTLKSFKIVNAETGMDFHDANQKKVTPDEYINGVLAENKMLKTAGDPPPKPTDPIITPGPDTKNQIPGMLNTINQQLEG